MTASPSGTSANPLSPMGTYPAGMRADLVLEAVLAHSQPESLGLFYPWIFQDPSGWRHAVP